MRIRHSKFSFFFATHAILIASVALALIPFGSMIFTAFASDGAPSLSNFLFVYKNLPLSNWLINSLFLASTQAALVVLITSAAGFTFAKHAFTGKNFLTAILLISVIVPQQVLLPGSYELIFQLGWINSFFAILIPSAANILALLMFRQAMACVPDELLNAARMDGCSETRLWWEIALPTIRPTVGAVSLITFLASWTSYLWPQIVLQDEMKFTVSMGLANLINQQSSQLNLGIIMAATLVSILPPVVLFLLMQKDFAAGITSGAMKG